MLQLAHKGGELYRRSIDLAKEVYRITGSFPDGERAVLVYTLRRLTVLLCQDIATAAVKKGKKQRRCFAVCLQHCIALDAQLELALAVNLLHEENSREAATLLQAIYKELTQRLQQG